MQIKRIYESVIEAHFADNRQMLFLVGPRQVGKTTTSLEATAPRPHHFLLNWDLQVDRLLITKGADAIAQAINIEEIRNTIPIIVLDELHKYGQWKNFLKGFFDKYSKKIQIVVTGSARLDVYKAGGDSLMGRYFLYRLHPLSVAELVNPHLRNIELSPISTRIDEEKFQTLLHFGGFPEPFSKGTIQFYNKWKKTRTQQLFQEDLRDLTRIQELGQLQVLAELLRLQTGQLTNFSALANKVNVSVDTIQRWIQTLKLFYFCYSLSPWSKNISRSLLKEPKIYLWDWSLISDEGAKIENFIASHLLKAVHFWTDQGFGEYELYFLRDKEKREVDFLVSKDGQPWFIVEVKKSSTKGISKSLYYFQKELGVKHALQVSFDMEYIDCNCFAFDTPVIVPARSFLSQLI